MTVFTSGLSFGRSVPIQARDGRKPTPAICARDAHDNAQLGLFDDADTLRLGKLGEHRCQAEGL